MSGRLMYEEVLHSSESEVASGNGGLAIVPGATSETMHVMVLPP